jgi:alkylhydroperoxidase family enzyme
MAPSPRIPPLPEGERDEDVRTLLGGLELNLFTTVVRHPGLYRKWIPFAGKLLAAGRLPPRERELVILRTAWNCKAEYEWGHHNELGRQAGLSDAEIKRVRDRADSDGWSEFDATLMRAADELHEDAAIGDQTWATLAERYDEPQLIELCMLVGHYHLVAFTLNSLRIQPEPGTPGFEAPE